MGLLQMLLGEGRTATPAAPPGPAAETKVAGAHAREADRAQAGCQKSCRAWTSSCCRPRSSDLGWTRSSASARDVTETVERRQASFVVVRVRKPKFVAKDRARNAETHVLQAEPPELPIESRDRWPGPHGRHDRPPVAGPPAAPST